MKQPIMTCILQGSYYDFDAELGMAERSHSFNSGASSARKDENSVTEAEAAAKAADELLGAPPRGNLLRGR